MCFPRLNKSFCCCSLRTGFFIVCWLGLIWNGYGLFHPYKEIPFFFDFFVFKLKWIRLTADELCATNQLYYMCQIVIYGFALIGIHWNRTKVLPLLIFNESILIIIYFVMTMVGVLITHNHYIKLDDDHFFRSAVYLGVNYYEYLIINSFYFELSQGRDGRGKDGNGQREMSFSPSAPNHTDLMSHPAQSVDIPDPRQTVILVTQPIPFQDCLISSMPQNSDAPPPYHTICEKPPAYT